MPSRNSCALSLRASILWIMLLVECSILNFFFSAIPPMKVHMLCSVCSLITYSISSTNPNWNRAQVFAFWVPAATACVYSNRMALYFKPAIRRLRRSFLLIIYHGFYLLSSSTWVFPITYIPSALLMQRMSRGLDFALFDREQAACLVSVVRD